MVTVRKKGKYDKYDLLDEYLLNQAAKYVNVLKLNLFARDLGLSLNEYDRITAPNVFKQDEQIQRVSTLRRTSSNKMNK